MSRVTRAAMACAALAALAGTGAVRAQSETEPLWEAGVGVGAVDFPDYRGASQSRLYALPVPYFVYRGKFLQADRRGVRGVFLDTERVDLNMSVGASLPVDSTRAKECRTCARRWSSGHRSNSACGRTTSASRASTCACPCAAR